MYSSSVFSSVFGITEWSEMGLYDIPMFMVSVGFGISMKFASFHVWGMMLLFSDMLYMLVRYASPNGPMCLRCLMLTLSVLVALVFFLCLIAPVACVFSYIYMSICVLCFMFECVGELFVECVCYLCGWGDCFICESYCVVLCLYCLCWHIAACL